MISFRPLAARIAGRMRPSAALEGAAAETVEWAPASTAMSPPIIQLPDEIDRVVAFNRTVTREAFLARCERQEVRHPPTIARRYHDAVIAHGSIYAGNRFQVIHQRERSLVLRGTPAELGERMLATNFVSEQYFGHWLLDGLCLELLADGRGIAPVGLAREAWLQEPGYRAAIGLALDRQAYARVADLWIVDDKAMNDGHAARMRALRQRVRAGVTPASPDTPVFLRREGGVRRPLNNQDVLADALARRGFAVLTPERVPVNTLRATLNGAPLVVSVEGSALCHAVANMPDGGTIVAIQPPRRVDWIQKVWADAAGLRLAQTVATDAGGDGFTMEEDRLLRLFDLIARETGTDS